MADWGVAGLGERAGEGGATFSWVRYEVEGAGVILGAKPVKFIHNIIISLGISIHWSSEFSALSR